MTDFENALTNFLQDRNDPERQSSFYNLFLNTNFFLPTVGEQNGAGEGRAGETSYAVPVVVEAEECDYLMLFDSQERLRAWAQEEVDFIEVPGHVIAANSVPQLLWALNVGSEPSKLFQEEEIAWLKEVVAHCDEDAAAGDDH